jgi:hypothetical protein
MRSRKNFTISRHDVHTSAQDWFASALQLEDHGPKCTAAVLVNILLLAVSYTRSLYAVCVNLLNGPTDQAARDALRAQLPKRPRNLEKRLNASLGVHLPQRVKRCSRRIAIDYHLIPYYGKTTVAPKQLYRSKSKDGTTKFHAYATACIIEHGQRFTLAYTWVKQGEVMTVVLDRLLVAIAAWGLKIRYLLVDRGFFSVAVMQFLQTKNIPFVLPVVLRGRKAKNPRKTKGLRLFLRKSVGWYTHTMKSKSQAVKFDLCVASRWYRHHRTKKRRCQKLLYAAWRVHTTPKELRELYRRRFGIETSYRQLRQALIRTSTPDPLLRLLFVGLALLLRNVWVWLHLMLLAEQRGDKLIIHLKLLRFYRLQEWIATVSNSLFVKNLNPLLQPLSGQRLGKT